MTELLVWQPQKPINVTWLLIECFCGISEVSVDMLPEETWLKNRAPEKG